MIVVSDSDTAKQGTRSVTPGPANDRPWLQCRYSVSRLWAPNSGTMDFVKANRAGGTDLVRRGSAGRSVDPRTLVERMTSLMPVPGAEWIRLHLADDAMSLWHATREASGDPDEPIPFWGMAWGGGLAIARYLRDHPDIAAGRRVLDLGSGSGLCAIAAALAGAQSVTAVEIDRYALAAIALNARANRQRIEVLAMDVLSDEPPAVDLVLGRGLLVRAPDGVACQRMAPRGVGTRGRCPDGGSRSTPPRRRGAARAGGLRRPDHVGPRGSGPDARLGPRLREVRRADPGSALADPTIEPPRREGAGDAGSVERRHPVHQRAGRIEERERERSLRISSPDRVPSIEQRGRASSAASTTAWPGSEDRPRPMSRGEAPTRSPQPATQLTPNARANPATVTGPTQRPAKS